MFKLILIILSSNLSFILVQATAYSSTTYKLLPNQPLMISNIIDTDITAYCIFNASNSVINSLTIELIQGSGSFNGTSIKQNQTMYQTIKNCQYTPLTAAKFSTAKITNTGPYLIEANCELT